MIFDLSKMLALPDTLLKTKSYFNKYSILRVVCAKKKRKKINASLHSIMIKQYALLHVLSR